MLNLREKFIPERYEKTTKNADLSILPKFAVMATTREENSPFIHVWSAKKILLMGITLHKIDLTYL